MITLNARRGLEAAHGSEETKLQKNELLPTLISEHMFPTEVFSLCHPVAHRWLRSLLGTASILGPRHKNSESTPALL